MCGCKNKIYVVVTEYVYFLGQDIRALDGPLKVKQNYQSLR